MRTHTYTQVCIEGEGGVTAYEYHRRWQLLDFPPPPLSFLLHLRAHSFSLSTSHARFHRNIIIIIIGRHTHMLLAKRKKRKKKNQEESERASDDHIATLFSSSLSFFYVL